MIIDLHTHTFPDRIAEHALLSLSGKSHSVAFSDGTSAGLIKRDNEAGIDLAIILPVATNPDQVMKVNDKAEELNARYAEVRERIRSQISEAAEEEDALVHDSALLSFACIHPGMKDAASELRRIKELGFKGIKIHPVYQGMDIDADPFIRILEDAADLGLIVVTHSGWDIGYPGAEQCLPVKIRRAVKAADPEGKTLKFIAAHMGGWRAWDEVPEQLADTGVYLDTAFSTDRFYPLDDGYYDGKDTSLMSADEFMVLVRAFGPERILFGTDSPWSDAKESIGFIKGLPVTGCEKDMILGGNAERLLGSVC